jgi:hypothetical protein
VSELRRRTNSEASLHTIERAPKLHGHTPSAEADITPARAEATSIEGLGCGQMTENYTNPALKKRAGDMPELMNSFAA